MGKIEELQKREKDLTGMLTFVTQARVITLGQAETKGVINCGYSGVPCDDVLVSQLVAALDEYQARLQIQLDQVSALLAKAEAALNPPVPETFYNTPNKWFEWNECDPNLMEDADDCISVAVCTADEWVDYVKSGKTSKLSYYGNDNGTQCVSQIIDAVNDINAGLEVSGDPTNAVIVVKWSK